MKKLTRARFQHFLSCSVCWLLWPFLGGWGLIILLCIWAIIDGIIENLK